MLSNAISDIVATVEQLVSFQSTFKIILSKPISGQYQKATITPFTHGDQIWCKCVKQTLTQDFTSTYEVKKLRNELTELLDTNFGFLDLVSQGGLAYIKQSRKGKIAWANKISAFNLPKEEIMGHDKAKNYLINANAPYLFSLGLSTKDGQIKKDSNSKFRQINKFIEIIEHHSKGIEIEHVADMGSGKGYLTFAMYDYLTRQSPATQITGYELRQDLVDKCNGIATEAKYQGLRFVNASIDSAPNVKIDMLVALHACDIATDMAIAYGVHNQAKAIILSPCCHKQIRKEIEILDPIIQHGIYLERQAEMITDTIRALLLESKGYKSQIIEYIHSEHTAKNTMIIAIKDKINLSALDTIESLKKQYGIKHHVLESMLG